MKEFVKTPNEVLDYGWDCAKWIPVGDYIVTSTWIVDAGITVMAQGNDNTSTSVWLSLGTVAGRYACTNRIVTFHGRTIERTFYVRIVDLRYA